LSKTFIYPTLILLSGFRCVAHFNVQFINEQGVQVSDTTGDDQRIKACKQKLL